MQIETYRIGGMIMYNFRIIYTIYTLDYDNDREIGYDFYGSVAELEQEISTFRYVSNICVLCENKELAYIVDSKIRKYNATASC